MPVVMRPPRQGRSVLKLSLGISLAMFVVVIAVLLLSGASAEASVCALSTTAPTTSWKTASNWTNCGGGYPGQSAVDTAVVGLGGFILNVDVAVPNSVILQETVFGVNLTIPATSALTLEPSSSLGSGGDVVNINGGTLTINTGGTLASTAPFNLNSGTLTLNGNLSFSSGSFTFLGGTLNGSGTLTVPVANTFPFNGANGAMTISGATVDDFGTISFTSAANALAINSGGHIKIESGGALNLANNAPINSDNVAGASIDVLSGGTMSKSGGTSTAIASAVNNAGQISLTAAGMTLGLGGGGTHTGAFQFGTNIGSAIVFGGNHTFNSPWSWVAPSGATFHVANGTSTINSLLVVSTFIQDSLSTVNGSGSIQVTSAFTWNGGTQSGAATTEIKSPVIANATSASVTLDAGRTLLIDSGATFNLGPASGSVMSIDNAAKVINNGSFFLLGDNDIQTNNSATSTISNASSALFQKSGGALTTINAGFNSTGSSTVRVSSGRIVLAGGPSAIDTTTIDLTAAGTALEFGGSANFTVNNLNTPVLGTTASSLRLTNSAGLKLLAGSLWPIPVTFVQDNSSTLQSPGGISLNGVYNFNGGTMDGGPGGGGRTLQVNPGSTLNITGTLPTTITNTWVIQNAGGTINYNPGAGGGLAITGSARLQNSSGSLNLQNSNGIGIASDGTGAMTNLGTITKSGGGTFIINPDYSGNGGTLTNLAGTLVFNGPGLSQGISDTVTANAGTTIEFRNGSIGWSGTFGGLGTYLISTGTVVYGGSFTAPPVVTQTGGDLFSAGGTFTVGPGSVYNWNGGTMGGPTNGGAVTINGGTLAINTGAAGVTLDNMTLNVGLGLASTATWTGGNPITLQNNAPIAMSTGGTFDIQAASSVNLGACAGCNAGFDVNGGSTLRKSVTASTVTLNAPVNVNGGKLDVLTGAMAINSSSAINDTGTFNIASGAFLGFVSGLNQIVTPATFTGTGTLKISGAATQLFIGATVTIANIDFIGGTFGVSNVSSSNSFVWDGGTLNGGNLTVSGGTATFSGASTPMDLSSFLTVASGATATYNSPVNRLNVNYPGGSIINSGTFTLASAVPITLTGTPPAGTYLFTNNAGATLNGNGTINVPVTNDGNLNPGTSPGMITINNAYTQTANGALNIDLNGTTAGTLYDQLNVNGAVTLDGTLKATLGYTPAAGDSYDVLTFTSRTGDFASKNLPTFGSGGTIQASYVAGPPQALRLLAVAPQADVAVTETASPTSIAQGQSATFKVVVGNNGPNPASGITITNNFTGGTFLSVTATAGTTCSGTGPITCTIASLNVAATETISLTLKGNAVGTMTNTATATSSSDPVSSNDTASASVAVKSNCPTTPGNQQPADGATNQQTSGVLTWSDVSAVSYNVFLGPAGTGCMTQVANVKLPSYVYSGLQPATTYEWRVEAVTPGCTVRSSTCIKFTTAGSSCPTTPPTLISPLNSTVNGPATFTWSSVPGAKDYQLFVNGKFVTTTTATSVGPISFANGPVVWFVIVEFDNCPSLTSSNGSFNSCDTSVKTIPSIVAQSDSGQTFTLFWDAVGGATKYEADEANDVNFTNPTTLTTTGTSLNFQHSVSTPTAFFYRVRAFLACANAFGSNSVSVRIVLSPATAPANPNVSAPSGSNTLIPILVHINGFPDGTFPFTASLDPQQPWLKRVDPSSGLLPPDGIILTVFADPTGLHDGTHTGTVIVLVTTPSKGGLSANGVTPVGAPVSISLVTPVTPKPSGPPPLNALIIPSTGHLDGINSRWASDVRILNTSSQTAHYQITFTPDNISQGVKQTVIETAAGSTTALDDVVKTWYGVGSLGESSNGALEIRPLDNPAKTGSDDAPSISFTTVASSRTYNAAPNSAAGTLGEFIPAILFQNFVGKAVDANHAATILSLQQIAQNDSMRTNFGVMEASGQPASVLISVFDSAGKKLLDSPLALQGGQHAQLNGFLAQNKISLNDGRIQVQVVGGDGKVTAYASVIDNKSGDPVLVSGVPLGQNSADTFVLAGVADLNTGNAAWRTDMRIFNPTSTPLNAQLTFYPLIGQGQPQSTSIGINPGEVKQLNNTLQSTFGLTNVGGAIHVQTATTQPLIVSGRTYDLTANGTYGQLLNATTAADAIGKGESALQVLQVEDSVRERTNVGIFEVTGKPATVEVTLFLPDSKIAPSTQIPLPANGFMQIPIVSSFGYSNVYNARVSMRVVGGDGRVGAYGSVIDQITQAPTLIPAQK